MATSLNKLALLNDAQGRYADAAVRLTKHMLTEAAADPVLGRAEALRRPMVSMLENPDNPFDAYPMFWALFVVVGEGGVPDGN